jgi:hypothetical protein
MFSGSVVAIAGLLLVSCGGEAVLVSPDTASPTAVVTATLATSPTVVAATPLPTPLGDVVWTTAVDPVTSAPTGVVAAISPDAPLIIAAVETNALAAGSRLKATPGKTPLLSGRASACGVSAAGISRCRQHLLLWSIAPRRC